MNMEKSATTEDTKTLSSRINKLVQAGYNENFKVSRNRLYGKLRKRSYQPEEVHIVNFFKFKRVNDPADNSILYAIETNLYAIETRDGTKGTLMDAFGSYADVYVDKFIKQVQTSTSR